MKEKIRRYFEKRENVYLALALFFGLVMALFNPPFAGVPDEGAHFYRAWGISDGHVVCGASDTINKAAYDLPGNLKPMKVPDIDHKIVRLSKIKQALFTKDSNESIPFGGIACGADPLGYVPQALGIDAGKIFGLPVLWSFYLARIFNMLAAVLITYYALKLLPFGKIVLMVVALLPMTMQQFASLSYDALHISVIFLFTAFVLNIAVRQKEKISRKELWRLGILSILAANIKWGFLPITLLLFALPISKFDSKKKYFGYTIGMILLSLLLFFVAQKTFIGEISGRAGVHTPEQIQTLISNPLSFPYIVLNSLYIGYRFYFETLLYKPGWLIASLSPLFYVAVLLGMIFLIRSEKEEVALSNKQRVVLGLTFLASLLFVFLSMYLYWTKAGSSKIQGVQSRYFLAALPLLILAFYKSKFHFSFDWIRRHMPAVIIVLVSAMFVSVFYSLWFMFYR